MDVGFGEALLPPVRPIEVRLTNVRIGQMTDTSSEHGSMLTRFRNE